MISLLKSAIHKNGNSSFCNILSYYPLSFSFLFVRECCKKKVTTPEKFTYINSQPMPQLYLIKSILLKTKVISLCHQYRTRPGCTIRVYTVDWPTLVLTLISQKIIIDSSKNERWTSPFKKFSWVRVTTFSVKTIMKNVSH